VDFLRLATLFGVYLLLLYGPMLVMYVLSFQGPNGGVTFPMVGVSFAWFADIVMLRQMANIPVSFVRSIALAAGASLLTATISIAAALAFRRRFPGSGLLFYLAIASLVMPSLLVGFGIGLGFKTLGLKPSLFTSALGAQLTWTLPFGVFAMFAGVNRFNRSYEEAADDLGASPWQRFTHVTLPILLPGDYRRGDGRLHLVLRRIRAYDPGDRRPQHPAARNLRADLKCDLADPLCHRHGHDRRLLSDHRADLVADLSHSTAPCRHRGRAMTNRGPHGGGSVTAEPRFDVELVAATKRYGETLAVDGLSLRIAPASYCCLLGPSGCGKTTT